MRHIQTFEGFLNEGNPFPMGPKTKKFTNEVSDEWDYFTDADEQDESLPDEWHTALKTLNVKADDAGVCFFDAVGSRSDVLDAAKKSGLVYAEVGAGEDGGSAGIVFSVKQ